MFTLIGYSENYGAAATLDRVTPIPDMHVRVEGDNIIVPTGMNYLLGAAYISAVGTAAQVESPSLRRMALLDLSKICAAAEPTFPMPFESRFYTPLPLDEFEPVRFLASVSGAGRATGLLWLGDGPQSPVTGDIYTVMATAAVTLTGYAWTNAPLTFSQTLPAGTYQVVGFRAESAGLLAARLVFVGGTWRPGVVGCDARSDADESIFRHGALGVWGEFRHDQPPTVDFLSSSADTAETVFLDLIKIA